MPRLGPHSRATAFAKLKPRTAEGRLFRHMREELVAHVGGNPSATQSALIDQACWLGLHLALMDRQLAEGRILSERNGRQYLAWSNSRSRLLRQLGLKGTPAPKRSLAEHMAGSGVAA